MRYALTVLGLTAAVLSFAQRLAQMKEETSIVGLTVIETVCVDDRATGYGTFQSHNQKVVSNCNGIFMTHIRTRNEPYTAQQWRLSRSADGGKRFVTLYESTNATSAPAMETDEQDNVYLARPDFVDGNAYLYRFLAAEKYAQPHISKIPNGSAGKYCMAYDSGRKQLYYFAHNNTFHVIGLDGTVLRSVNLLQAGRDAVLQYPLLHLDRDGVLHAAWTTQKHGVYLYWDIHYMQSRDGGQTWQKMDGTPITLPVVADQHGAADRITLDDEFDVHTWLSNLMVKDGKAHFVYLAQTQPSRQHYVRYDLKTAKKDVDIFPEFKGEKISLRALDGFFATRAALPNAPLYCVLAQEGRIACLASDDNGATWHDYAVSEKRFKPYAIGGCRELTTDGCIIGAFTDQLSSTDAASTAHVYFFKIQAGLSSAKVVSVSEAKGTMTLKFADVRGQPGEIRFRHADTSWSQWQPFQTTLTVRMKARPTHFQLKSRMGVVSTSYELKGDFS